jgi:hypothetical protein
MAPEVLNIRGRQQVFPFEIRSAGPSRPVWRSAQSNYGDFRPGAVGAARRVGFGHGGSKHSALLFSALQRISQAIAIVAMVITCTAPAHGQCIRITSPTNGALILKGPSVPIVFSDRCTNRWYECAYVNQTGLGCATPNPQQFIWPTSNFALGTYTLTVKSFRSGGRLLGSASVKAYLIAPATPTPKPTPVPTPTPTPTPTPCIRITAPQPGQVVGGIVPISTLDTCTGLWFETLFVDNTFVGAFAPGAVTWQTVEWVNGNHQITVTSQSSNPGSRVLGSASETLNVQNGPTPTPSAMPTPNPICLVIISPTSGSTLSGDVAIHTSDTCAGVNHEAMFVDGGPMIEFGVGQELLSTDDYPNGRHTVKIEAHSAQPNEVILATTSTSYVFENPSPAPTPSLHFGTEPGTGRFADGSTSVPTDAECAAMLSDADETIPANQATHVDDLNIGITSPVNQTRARPADLERLINGIDTFDLNSSWNNDFWFRKITGQYTGSTWNIFRLAACKYGIDEDAVRAQATSENGSWVQWHSGGDRRTTLSECRNRDVNLFGYICENCCYQSWGDFQTKVFYATMTWPMMEYSTTFSAEFRFASQRACMNGDQAPYFASADHLPNTYSADVSAYLSNPGGVSPHNFLNPITGKPATNQDWMLFGCLSSHFSGGWMDAAAQSYLNTLLTHWRKHDWITSPN